MPRARLTIITCLFFFVHEQSTFDTYIFAVIDNLHQLRQFQDFGLHFERMMQYSKNIADDMNVKISITVTTDIHSEFNPNKLQKQRFQ